MDVYGDPEHEKTIAYLQKWFEDNNKLPNKIDRISLTRFYYCMYKDVEETKKLLEIHYALRQSTPDLFINRDPEAEASRHAAAYGDFSVLPALTPENYRIQAIRLNNPDPKQMNFYEDIKSFIMLTDAHFSKPDVVIGNTAQIAEGDLLIVDMSFFTMKHMTRVSVSAFHSYAKYLQKAYPGRMKGIHMINCPSFMGKIIAVLKPFMSKEVGGLIHFHFNGLDTLYEYIPKEILHEEYGGNAGKISELKEKSIQLLKTKRDYLMDSNYWKIEKSQYSMWNTVWK